MRNINIQGKDIIIKGNRIFVDGVEHTEGLEQRSIITTVKVEGNVSNLEIDNGDVFINGDVFGPVSSTNGDVKICGDLDGTAKTVNGDINVMGAHRK